MTRLPPAAWLTVAIFGSAMGGTVTKLIGQAISPVLFACITFFVGAVFNAMVFFAFRKETDPRFIEAMRDNFTHCSLLTAVVACAVLSNEINYFMALKVGKDLSLVGPFCAALTIIFSLFAARIVFREHITPRQAFGIGLALIGAGLLYV